MFHIKEVLGLRQNLMGGRYPSKYTPHTYHILPTPAILGTLPRFLLTPEFSMNFLECSL